MRGQLSPGLQQAKFWKCQIFSILVSYIDISPFFFTLRKRKEKCKKDKFRDTRKETKFFLNSKIICWVTARTTRSITK